MEFFKEEITEDNDEKDIIQENGFFDEYDFEQSAEEEKTPVKAMTEESRLFRDYLQEVGTILRMTRNDEKRFGALLHVYAKKIENYKRHMETVSKKSARYKKYKILSDHCRRGYERVRNSFVSRNLRFVIMFAMRYKNSKIGASYSLTDMIQMGNMGLIRAVERFDWRRNNTFGAYASWWIIQAITRGINEEQMCIRIPAWALERSRKVFAIADEMRSKEEPFSFEEIAERAGLPIAAVQEILGVSTRVRSFDEPQYAGEGRMKTLHDILPDENAISPDRNSIENALKETVQGAFSHLTERERDILEMRFGFKGNNDHETLDTLGKKYGLTRERIRQIQNSALQKIKNNPGTMENLYSFWGK